MYDDLGAGLGSSIAISEGGEAAQPFRTRANRSTLTTRPSWTRSCWTEITKEN